MLLDRANLFRQLGVEYGYHTQGFLTYTLYLDPVFLMTVGTIPLNLYHMFFSNPTNSNESDFRYLSISPSFGVLLARWAFYLFEILAV